MMSVKRALGLLVVALICSACGNTIWVSDNFMAAKGPPDRGEYHPLSLDRTPRWSPDGRYLVVNINDFVRSIDDVAGPFTPNPDVSNPHLYSVSVADSSFRRVFIEAEGVQSGAQMAGDGRVFFVEYAYKPRVGPVRKDSSPHYRNIGIAAPDGTLQSQIPLPSESPRNVSIIRRGCLKRTASSLMSLTTVSRGRLAYMKWTHRGACAGWMESKDRSLGHRASMSLRAMTVSLITRADSTRKASGFELR